MFTFSTSQTRTLLVRSCCRFAILFFATAGSSFARGNENNLDQPDGIYYLGSGKSAGYGIGNIGAHYQVHPHIQLFVQVNNVLDKHYSTGAQLGTIPFDNNNHFAPVPSERPTAPATATFPSAPPPTSPLEPPSTSTAA